MYPAKPTQPLTFYVREHQYRYQVWNSLGTLLNTFTTAYAAADFVRLCERCVAAER